MPDWVPQVVPVLCPCCGAYWECGCSVVSQEEARARFIPEVWPKLPAEVLEIAAGMGIPPKDVVDELTRIQQEHERRFISPLLPKMTKAAWERALKLQELGYQGAP